jgi:hypothetical protein
LERKWVQLISFPKFSLRNWGLEVRPGTFLERKLALQTWFRKFPEPKFISITLASRHFAISFKNQVPLTAQKIILNNAEGTRRSAMPTNPKIVQLRQQLSERFPGARFTAEPAVHQPDLVWPTHLPQLDRLLDGGLRKGAITEIVAEKNGCGSALLISALLQRVAEDKQILAFVDGQDSFDPAGFTKETLSRLLWIRCKTAEQALKASDFILRDRNLPLVFLDLQLNPATQLRKIPSSTWYRLQRIVEGTSTIFTVFTPRAMVGCAYMRINLQSRFDLHAVEQQPGELLAKLKVELTHHRLHISQPEERVAKAG